MTSIICLVNNKIYVGQTTKGLDYRKAKHYNNSKYNTFQTKFYRAIRKYGFDNFEWSILEKCTTNKLNEREIYWIDSFNSMVDGYNMTPGGGGFGKNLWWYNHILETQGKEIADEKLLNWKANKSGLNHPLTGKTFYHLWVNAFGIDIAESMWDDYILNQQQTHKNKTHTKATKIKISKAVSGSKNPMYNKSLYDTWEEKYGKVEADLRMINYKEIHKSIHLGADNGMFGKTHSDQSKEKMRNAKIGKIGKKHNRYVSIDMDKLQRNKELSIKRLASMFNVSEYVIKQRLKDV